MPRATTTKATHPTGNSGSAQHLGFEATLWATADKLRGNLDAAEYKHVVLGLIFLKYISDAFEERHAELEKDKAKTGANPEDRDEYTQLVYCRLPKNARKHPSWPALRDGSPVDSNPCLRRTGP